MEKESVLDDRVTIKEYELNTIEDTIFIEPDVSEYTIRENN